ncbi:ferredoxin-2, mitochondrial [Pancytospora philotis]|nr:ferredoxin-2, mitochondrial [Pancytospora philotis]
MKEPGETVDIFFQHQHELLPVKAYVGETLLDAAHRNKVPLEGACEGSLACSTCHVVVDKELFDPNAVSDRENDLLDLAFGLQPTSRLGCQVVVCPKMTNKIFEIPRCTRNLAVDGYRPPLH